MSTTALTVLAVAFAVFISGCRSPELEHSYGTMRDAAGGTSIHGTSVLARMFTAAGHDVTVVRNISPRLSQFQVLVWVPDDYAPPSLAQRIVLEDWLALGGRTLVYVGRDFDARPGYWRHVRPQLPVRQQLEAEALGSRAQAEHDRRRLAAPSRAFARWFTFQRDPPPQRIVRLHSDHGWTAGIDPAKTDLYVAARLLPPTAEDVPAFVGGIPAEEPIDLELLEPTDLDQQGRVPDDTDVLLSASSVPLVFRVRDTDWSTSQILVVANGSFLLNLPLVNREHRKLAGHVIAACGDGTKVGFLETDSSHRGVLLAEPKAQQPTGLEAFSVWPLGFILLQAMLLGLVICFAMFPVFGRPREPAAEGIADFARHIDALGRLLELTRDEQYAGDQLRHYRAAPPPGSAPL